MFGRHSSRDFVARRATGFLVAASLAGLAGCDGDDVRVYRAPKDPAPHAASADPSSASQPPRQPASPSPQLAWTAPPGWIDKGAGGMRAGSFAIHGTNQQTAEVSVIAMQTWTGQELGNVNRWRGQVGLPRLRAEQLPQHTAAVTIAGIQAPLFDMVGPAPGSGKPTRILVAVLPLAHVAWYFKMTGDDGLVAGQKAAFTAFLESVILDPPTPRNP
ncbi:MAG: hypothetical protein JXQ71_12770 [Verrucomicrobia bacterium]|nr:hypothetical protein [Verrucomicrobiota bacterium]